MNEKPNSVCAWCGRPIQIGEYCKRHQTAEPVAEPAEPSASPKMIDAFGNEHDKTTDCHICGCTAPQPVAGEGPDMNDPRYCGACKHVHPPHEVDCRCYCDKVSCPECSRRIAERVMAPINAEGTPKLEEIATEIMLYVFGHRTLIKSEIADILRPFITPACPKVYSALKRLYEETADYIRINHLGDVHHNQAMKDARDALSSWTDRDMTVNGMLYKAGTVTIADILDHAARTAHDNARGPEPLREVNKIRLAEKQVIDMLPASIPKESIHVLADNPLKTIAIEIAAAIYNCDRGLHNHNEQWIKSATDEWETLILGILLRYAPKVSTGEANGWISVRERLPETSGIYEVIISHAGEENYRDGAVYDPMLEDEWTFSSDQNHTMMDLQVTRWRKFGPLPPAPSSVPQAQDSPKKPYCDHCGVHHFRGENTLCNDGVPQAEPPK